MTQEENRWLLREKIANYWGRNIDGKVVNEKPPESKEVLGE